MCVEGGLARCPLLAPCPPLTPPSPLSSGGLQELLEQLQLRLLSVMDEGDVLFTGDSGGTGTPRDHPTPSRGSQPPPAPPPRPGILCGNLALDQPARGRGRGRCLQGETPGRLGGGSDTLGWFGGLWMGFGGNLREVGGADLQQVWGDLGARCGFLDFFGRGFSVSAAVPGGFLGVLTPPPPHTPSPGLHGVHGARGGHLKGFLSMAEPQTIAHGCSHGARPALRVGGGLGGGEIPIWGGVGQELHIVNHGATDEAVLDRQLGRGRGEGDSPARMPQKTQ